MIGLIADSGPIQKGLYGAVSKSKKFHLGPGRLHSLAGRLYNWATHSQFIQERLFSSTELAFTIKFSRHSTVGMCGTRLLSAERLSRSYLNAMGKGACTSISLVGCLFIQIFPLRNRRVAQGLREPVTHIYVICDCNGSMILEFAQIYVTGGLLEIWVGSGLSPFFLTRRFQFSTGEYQW